MELSNTENKQRTVAPLEIDLVVARIMLYLSERDLLNIRVVNRHCHTMSNNALKRRSKCVSFVDEFGDELGRMRRFVQCYDESMRLFGIEYDWPFTKFEINADLLLTRNPESEEHPRTAKFWVCVGPILTELSLLIKVGLMGRWFRFQLPPANVQLCKLQKLKLDICAWPEMEGPVRSGFSAFLKRLLKHSKPQALAFDIRETAYNFRFRTWLLKPMQATDLSQLTKLRVKDRNVLKLLLPFSKLNLKLKFLHLEETSYRQMLSSIPTGHVQNFFNGQAKTLTHLELSLRNIGDPVVGGVIFSKLEQLTLDTRDDGPISYAIQFPSLKTLKFRSYLDNFYYGFLVYCGESSLTVEEVILPQDFVTDIFPPHLARLFPNLKKIWVNCQVRGWTETISHLQNVEEITFYATEYDGNQMDLDAALTGLKDTDTETYRRTGSIPSLEDAVETQAGTNKLKSVWNQIKCVRVRGPHFKISDLACVEVLLKMENLHTLDFSRVLYWKSGRSGSLISDEVLERMQNKLKILLPTADNDYDYVCGNF